MSSQERHLIVTQTKTAFIISKNSECMNYNSLDGFRPVTQQNVSKYFQTQDMQGLACSVMCLSLSYENQIESQQICYTH